MSTRKIENERWTGYFDHLSNVSGSQLIKIEIVSMSIGDQVEVEDVEFAGISYDNDVISIQAGSLEHMIKQPRKVYVLEDDDGLKSMEITDAEENKHILSFKAAT